MAHSLFKPKRRDQRTGKRKVGRFWHGQYRLDNDEAYTRVSLRTTDKRVAQQRLNDLVEREERQRAGLLVPAIQSEAASVSLEDHLAAFLRYQSDRNVSKGYTRKIDQRVKRLISECGWERVCDVTAESFIAWRNGQTLTPKTLNDYQHAIYSVLNWLKKTGRVEVNPIANVGRVDGRGKQSFIRRAFTDDEVKRLLAVSEARRPVYLLALHTGLRLSELRALRWSDIDLAKSLIRLRAGATKSRRADVLPITPTAQAIIRDLRAACDGEGRVLRKGVPSHHTFRADLKAAGIERFDTRGYKVDFHAQRVTFVTNLARAGVSQRQTMALARHTDPKLTANLYTDQDALPLAEAAAKLPTYGLIVEAPKDAHGRSQESFPAGHSVTQPVTRARKTRNAKSPENTVLSGVKRCQSATRQDAEQKWSRGESNPRAEKDHLAPLRV
jgi:integrase